MSEQGRQTVPVDGKPRDGLAEPGREPRRILVAEDHVVNQKVALGFLKQLGHQADAVADGREALTALQSTPYDLVLMDCQMPELDGYEATRRIRSPTSQVLDRDVPVIAMTGHTSEADREKCLAAGMDDYLCKPIVKNALAEMLRRWLPGGGTDEDEVAAEASSPERATAQSVDAARLEVLRELGRRADHDLVGELSKLFIERGPRGLEEVRQALAAQDFATAEHVAHSLKGTCGNLGATRMAKLAAALEQHAAAGALEECSRQIEEVAKEFERVAAELREILSQETE
ncbi:MAG: response regulator [bacterium]|nr:response regulator [bacterium]